MVYRNRINSLLTAKVSIEEALTSFRPTVCDAYRYFAGQALF